MRRTMNRLRAELVLKGMTQTELAKKIGMSPATLSRKMAGAAADFSRTEMLTIKMILRTDTSMDDLFSVEGAAEMLNK